MARNTTFNKVGTTLYEDQRGYMIVYRRDRTGAVDLTQPVSFFTDLIIQSAQETDPEKVQIALADAPKLYAFGSQHRFYTFNAIVLDTKLSNQSSDALITKDSGDSTWDGQSMEAWRKFYENYAKLSVASRERYLVMFFYGSRTIWGAINQMALNHTSVDPNHYSVVFSFYVVHSEERASDN